MNDLKDNKIPTTTAKLATLPTAKEEVSGGAGVGLPPNGSFALWQMLMAILDAEKSNLDNYAELQQDFANTLGGTKGILAMLYHNETMIGKEQAEGIRDDAWGKMASAITIGAQVGLAGASYAFGTRPQINEAQKGLDDVNAFKNETQSISGLRIAGKENSEVPVDPKIQDRIDDIAEGSRPVGIRSSKEGLDGITEEELNRAAARHAKGDQLKKINTKISDKEKQYRDQINNADTNFNTRTQMINLVGTGVQTAIQSAAGGFQADAKIREAGYTATDTVTKETNQSISEQERKEQQAAVDAQHTMNEIAGAIGNWASASSRA